MGLERQRWPGNTPSPVSKQVSSCWQVDIMASDSESSHTGTHSQGLSPLPGMPPTQPLQGTANISMREMLSPSAARRRSSVRGGMPGIMKRAVSSPNVRDLANLDTSAMSNAEKKRNKLGYHRTAVACVHCRRRKIRCILAMDESTTRCQNCIRLKKDCQYYPVDQQPLPGKTTRSSALDDESINESPTPETSPATGSTSWDQSEVHRTDRYKPSTVASERPRNFPFAGSMLQSEHLGSLHSALSRADADYTSAPSNASYSSLNMYAQPPWSSTPVLNSPLHSTETVHFDDSHLTHWQPHSQPGSFGHEISSYPSSVMQTPLYSSTQEQFPHYPASHGGESHVLPHLPYHPSRSMSLATPNDLQNYHSPYHNESPMFLQRHPANSSSLSLSLFFSNTNPTPPSSDTHSTPNTYTYGDHPQPNSSYHSGTPMQSPSMAVSSSEAFGGQWSTGLADVKEEEEMANMHHHNSMGGRFRQSTG